MRRERWRKRFFRFRESGKKREELSNQIDGIQSLTDSYEESEFIFTDSDGNVIVSNGRKTMEIIHSGYKEHLKEESFSILLKKYLGSKDENNSNVVALTYSMEHESLIAVGREYIGISLGDEYSVDPCMNTAANHLITASLGCVVIILHNHPSLSKFSLEDVQFFLRNVTVKMMVVITNLGGVSYLVKRENIDQYNNAMNLHNEGNGIKDYQKTAAYFLSSYHEANIVYEDR